MSVRPTTNLSSIPDLRQLQDEWRGLGREVEKFDTESAQRFVDVADSLGTPQEDRWSHIGVLEHLGVDSIERRAIQQLQGSDRVLLVVRIAEWFRNVLILLPVLVTWFGLYEAATNYEAAVKAQPDLQFVSFLLLWQQNFMNKGVTTGLPFSTIAAIDFSVLLVIIGLTFFVHLERDVLEARATNRAADLRRRIDGLAWRTSLWLADKSIQQRQQEQSQWNQRLQTFDRFTPTAQDFLAALIADQELIARLATDYQQEFDHLRLLSSDLANAAGSVPASIQQLQQANSQSWSLLQGSLTNSLSALQQVAAQHNQLQSAIAATNNEVRQAGQALTTAANQTGQAATAAAQASAQASGLVQQLQTSQAGLQDKLRDTSTALQGSAASFANIATTFDQLRPKLDGLMQSNGQVINTLGALIQQQQPTFQKFEQIAVAFQTDARQIHTDFAQLAQLDVAVMQEIRQSVAATLGLSQRIDGLMQVLYRAPVQATSARPAMSAAEAQPAYAAQPPSDVAAQPISPTSQEKRGSFIDRIFGGGAKS